MRDLLIGLVAGLFWAAIIEVFHGFGWHPDRQIAGLFMRTRSTTAQRVSFWGLAAAFALATLFAVNWFLPLESSSPGGLTITNNHGIITKGQTGDNTIK
ncbi:MAG: hypothetical protein P4M15_04950 [Alphaproteobacteria bacterium]|nr:hypothetical protein [Alphaproteobacteria bacterium]